MIDRPESSNTVGSGSDPRSGGGRRSRPRRSGRRPGCAATGRASDACPPSATARSGCERSGSCRRAPASGSCGRCIRAGRRRAARVQVEVEQGRPAWKIDSQRPVVGRVLGRSTFWPRACARRTRPNPCSQPLVSEHAVGVDAELLAEQLAQRRVAEARPVGEDPVAVGCERRRRRSRRARRRERTRARGRRLRRRPAPRGRV